MAWLSGYQYRKLVTLSRASGAVTDYQMKLLLGESAGAVGEDVDCNSHVQADFDDLRFTILDGTTLLDYWIELITGNTPNQLATVWIEFNSIGTDATTFYMYYGRAVNDTLPINAPTQCEWVRPQSTPVLAVGTAGQWDDFWVALHSIWKEGDTYYGYYSGSGTSDDFQIGLATSSDGITWTRHGSNPILTPGAVNKWDDYAVVSPIVWKEGATWNMLYAGEGATGGAWRIGLATSSDGIAWTRYDVDNPVMIVTEAAWDSFLVVPGTNIFKEGNTYYLYYWGGTSADGGNGNWKIGLATSTDLHSWTKSENNPLLSPAGTTFEQGALLEPYVTKFGSTYYMWYQGNNSGGTRSRIGLASSSYKDSAWARYNYNPILDAEQGSGTDGVTGIWDTRWVETPILVNHNNYWRLYYSGSQGAAGTPRMQTGVVFYQRKGDGNATFLLFDDFQSLTLDTVKWNNSGTFTQDRNGIEKYASDTNLNYLLLSQNNITGPLAIKARGKVGSDWSDERGWIMALLWDSAWATTGYLGGHYKDATSDFSRIYKFGTGATNNGTNEAFGSADTYYNYELIVGASAQKFLIDGTQKGSIAVAIQTNPTKIALATGRPGAGAIYTTYFDWILVRQYLDTEPAWGNWGSEEEAPPSDTAKFFLMF